MKDGIHPDYRPVVFLDSATGTGFVTRSTARTDRTITWTDGETYPMVPVDVSSASHPFWTGTRRILDTEGAVERFRRRYGDRPARPERRGRPG